MVVHEERGDFVEQIVELVKKIGEHRERLAVDELSTGTLELLKRCPSSVRNVRSLSQSNGKHRDMLQPRGKGAMWI